MALDIFQCMLAAFLLLTLSAAGRSIWRVVHPANTSASSDAEPGIASKISDVLLLVAVATAWYTVAAGCICQFTIYPLYPDFAKLGPGPLHAFGSGYTIRLASIILPSGVMCLASALLLWIPPCNVPLRTVWAVVGLCVAFIGLTAIAGPVQAQMRTQGFSENLYARLMWSNGIRSLIFAAIGLLFLAAVRSRWSHSASRL